MQVLSQKFTVTKQRINNKPGYWINTGESMWELEPQVDFGEAEGVLKTRADFVLRPFKQAERSIDNEVVIYTDGFEYHWDKITDDLCKRLSLLRSGRKVWVLTWDDLALASVEHALSKPDLLLSGMQATDQAKQLWQALASKHEWPTSNEIRGLLEQGSLAWLTALMTEKTTTQQELTASALCISLLQLKSRPELEAFIDKSVEGTGEWQAALLSALPSQAENWQAISETEASDTSAWQLLSYIAPENRSRLVEPIPPIHVLMAINDNLAENNKNSDFKDQWRAIWQAFNLLQYAPSFSIATQTGLQAGLFTDLLTVGEQAFASQPSELLLNADWQDVIELSCLTAEQIEAVQQFTQQAPEVGIDLTGTNGATLGTLELAWENLKVALVVDELAKNSELQDWQFISLESDNWLEQLKLALSEGK